MPQAPHRPATAATLHDLVTLAAPQLPTPTTATLRAIRIVFFVFGAFVATWVSRLPLIKHDLDLGTGQLSIALLGGPVGLVLAMRFVAALIARSSSRTVGSRAVVAVAIAGVLPALAWNLASLAAALLLLGASFGALDIAMNTQAVAIERGAGTALMSGIHGWYSVGVLTASGAGALAATFDVAPVLHFTIASVLLGGSGLLAARALLGVEADRTRTEPDADGALHVGGVLRNPRVLLVGVIAFSCFFVEGSVDDWSGVYLHEVQGASLGFAPLAAAACGLGMAIGRFRGDAVIRRIGRRGSMQRGALVAAAGMLLAVLVPVPLVAIVGYGVLGVGVATLIPIAFTLAGNVPGVAPALSISRVTTFGYVGLFVGPPIIGFVAHGIGLGGALGITVAMLLGVALLGRRLRAED